MRKCDWREQYLQEITYAEREITWRRGDQKWHEETIRLAQQKLRNLRLDHRLERCTCQARRLHQK